MEVGVKLAKMMDSCQILQLREDRILGTKYFHFKVLVDITKPLAQIFRLVTPAGMEYLGLLKYERFPNLCFYVE